jgi:hypothetical protein
MKPRMISFAAALLMTGALAGQAVDVGIEKIPSSMEELVSLRDRVATTPEGGAAVLVVAMIMYGDNPGLGLQAFTLALDMDELASGTVYKGYRPKRSWDDRWAQIDKFPFLGKIYVRGTKADDAYALPDSPLAVTVTEVRAQADGSAKAFVATTSGNMPRPVLLKKNDKGLWKVSDASSVFVGPSALPPAKKSDDL